MTRRFVKEDVLRIIDKYSFYQILFDFRTQQIKDCVILLLTVYDYWLRSIFRYILPMSYVILF